MIHSTVHAVSLSKQESISQSKDQLYYQFLNTITICVSLRLFKVKRVKFNILTNIT